MNKAELIDAVAERADCSKAEAGRTLDAILEVITGAMQEGDSVTLIGFGTFLVRDRAARDGVNPKTGEKMRYEAKKAPAFKPGKALKDAVN